MVKVKATILLGLILGFGLAFGLQPFPLTKIMLFVTLSLIAADQIYRKSS